MEELAVSCRGVFVLPREQSTTPAAGTSGDAYRTEINAQKR